MAGSHLRRSGPVPKRRCDLPEDAALTLVPQRQGLRVLETPAAPYSAIVWLQGPSSPDVPNT
jgi:hypothetical protein